jgi:hypothetical protein
VQQVKSLVHSEMTVLIKDINTDRASGTKAESLVHNYPTFVTNVVTRTMQQVRQVKTL